ncbi:hypothetical protein TcasGA2_TC003089 [Tribolium castaneum]|uniref:Uncharacterized protein n=1 Tax=Tribolium castaneum TaxID=7070 RepID=D6WFE7_TRICA|nr:hypothetical protein TcasGA2_TC003089 [Tribolium castaneum]
MCITSRLTSSRIVATWNKIRQIAPLSQRLLFIGNKCQEFLKYAGTCGGYHSGVLGNIMDITASTNNEQHRPYFQRAAETKYFIKRPFTWDLSRVIDYGRFTFSNLTFRTEYERIFGYYETQSSDKNDPLLCFSKSLTYPPSTIPNSNKVFKIMGIRSSTRMQFLLCDYNASQENIESLQNLKYSIDFWFVELDVNSQDMQDAISNCIRLVKIEYLEGC